MSSDTSSSRPPRKRIQFTRQQKQEIRDFYNSHPQCTAKVLHQWFEDKHGLPLRPSTISTILRSSDKSTGSNNVIRARLPKFPELENQLRQWVDQRMLRERDNVNFYITNEMLKTAAQDIWKSLQENNINKPDSGHLPSFSEGWIEKFKRRTNMPRLRRKSSISKSKSGSPTTMPVPVVPTAKRQESNITDNTTFNNINWPNQHKQDPPHHQYLQHNQYHPQPKPIQQLSPINYSSSLPSQIKLPSPYELLSSASPPSLVASPSPQSTLPPASKSSPAYSSPESISSIHSILNPVEENADNNHQQEDTPKAYSFNSPRDFYQPQQQSERLPSLTPDSVAKCHLNILKIYLEQNKNNEPLDMDLQKIFTSFEKVIDSRSAARFASAS